MKVTADFNANLSCRPRPATENVIMLLNISDGKEYSNNGHFLRNYSHNTIRKHNFSVFNKFRVKYELIASAKKG